MQRLTTISVAFLTTATLFCSIGLGQTPSNPPPDKIEEDWQVVLGSPNPNEAGPQLTTCMSPVSDSSTPFFAFNLNYCDYPSFQAGGLQVKVCSGQAVPSSSNQGTAVCQTSGETITWTQRMRLGTGSVVKYSVVNGQSTTWGNFGTGQGLTSVNFNTSLTTFPSYNPDTSVANSGAGWQSNRVSQMTLVRVRYYNSGLLISTDNNPRSVSLSK